MQGQSGTIGLAVAVARLVLGTAVPLNAETKSYSRNYLLDNSRTIFVGRSSK